MKKLFVLLPLLFALIAVQHPCFAKQSLQIDNENSFLAGNFIKTPKSDDGVYNITITNKKSFLHFNFIMVGKVQKVQPKANN